MTTEQMERMLENRCSRRVFAEDRYLSRRERLEARAEKMIGQLCRDGRTVYYVVQTNGKVREANWKSDLVDFLIRRKYV
jgi:hypothetical protein